MKVRRQRCCGSEYWVPLVVSLDRHVGEGVALSVLNRVWLMYCVCRFQEQHPEMDFSNAKMG